MIKLGIGTKKLNENIENQTRNISKLIVREMGEWRPMTKH